VSTKSPSRPREIVHDVADRLREEESSYAAGHPRPLGGYATLLSVYTSGVAGLAWAIHRRGRLPDRVPAGDLVLLTIATHKLSRLVAKDSVTALFRAPFTRFEEPIGEGEVNEEVRGTGVRHATGELLTCPFCIGQWIATAFVGSYVLAPRATRAVASVFAILAGSDALQFGYSALRKAEQ
jgi:hypothetical protein